MCPTTRLATAEPSRCGELIDGLIAQQPVSPMRPTTTIAARSAPGDSRRS
jgi:hypothetical protein